MMTSSSVYARALGLLHVVFLLLSPAHAVSIPSTLSLFPSTANGTNGLQGTFSSTGKYSEHCDAHYGSDLNPSSCGIAWRKIIRSKDKITFRSRRGIQTEDTPVPFRYLSNDGLCAIDINLVPGVEEDTSDGEEISEQAGALLVGCAYKHKTGGAIQITSKHHIRPACFIVIV